MADFFDLSYYNGSGWLAPVQINMDASNAIPVSFRETFGAVPVLTIQRRGIALQNGTAAGLLGSESSVRPDGGPGDPWLGARIRWLNGATYGTATLFFTGDVIAVNPHFDQHLGWVLTYTCAGLRNRLDWFPHTDQATGLDVSAFNLTPTDPNYDPSRAGRTVGQIISTCLLMTADGSLENPGNVANLKAQGIGNINGGGSLPAITVADLALLTLIPPRPVYFGGEKLGDAIDSLISQWAPNHRWWIDPSGNLRFFDLRSIDATRGFPVTTLTMGTDPIEPTELCRDTSKSFQRVVLKGQPTAIMALLKESNGDLVPRFGGWGGYADTVGGSNSAKAAWTPSQYTNPNTSAGPTQSSGTVSSFTTTTVTFIPTSGLLTWSANFWANNQGTINLASSVLSGFTQYWSARIVADTGTSGGQATFTVDNPLGSGSYTTATISGVIPGPGLVYTRYQVANKDLKGRLTGQSTYPQAFVNASQTGATTLSSPMGLIIRSDGSSFPLAYTYNNNDTTDPTHATIRFISPTYIVANNADPSVAPADVWIYQPVYTNGLYAVYPHDSGGNAQYGGTSNAIEGLRKTLTVTIDQWTDPGQFGVSGPPPTLLQLYAYDLWTSVSDAVVEGPVTYYGLFTAALTFGCGLLIAGQDLSSASYTTGWEPASYPAGGTAGPSSGSALGLPVRSVEVEWPQMQGQIYVTRMHCSNRRDTYAVEQFLKPARQVGFSIGIRGTMDVGTWGERTWGGNEAFNPWGAQGGGIPTTAGSQAGINGEMPGMTEAAPDFASQISAGQDFGAGVHVPRELTQAERAEGIEAAHLKADRSAVQREFQQWAPPLGASGQNEVAGPSGQAGEMP